MCRQTCDEDDSVVGVVKETRVGSKYRSEDIQQENIIGRRRISSADHISDAVKVSGCLPMFAQTNGRDRQEDKTDVHENLGIPRASVVKIREVSSGVSGECIES